MSWEIILLLEMMDRISGRCKSLHQMRLRQTEILRIPTTFNEQFPHDFKDFFMPPLHFTLLSYAKTKPYQANVLGTHLPGLSPHLRQA